MDVGLDLKWLKMSERLNMLKKLYMLFVSLNILILIILLICWDLVIIYWGVDGGVCMKEGSG